MSSKQFGSTKATSVFKALDRTLDPLGPEMKDALYLHLAKKYGISFVNDYAPVNEIEDALVIIFDSGAQPLIRQFKDNLKTRQSK